MRVTKQKATNGRATLKCEHSPKELLRLAMLNKTADDWKKASKKKAAR
jgi:hypothetical protein